ncbi:DUF4403 family protein [Spirosoma montaniterrae]|uniref:DUF4403 domain-containing protein n=1 Tax=Spirosoma montaniterrae TaxID=1178516 RepID=A0A1P9WUP5_9BACT|nr:DUF4403 family protein [Spirosoma montaniterrae]AQG79060.1 hypothetical protein AWR27_06815 [Spirosoma montaniterrae]
MTTQRITGILFLLLALLGAIGCNRVRPDAPATLDFEPPIPDPVSYVAGEVTFRINDLERKINKSLNPVLVNEETFKGRKGEAWHLRVVRTGPVKIQYANQRVSFSAPLQVWYSNPLGLRKHRKSRPLCALAVNFVSPLSVESNWRLATRSRFEQYRWIQKPKIRLLGINVGITKLAENLLDKRRAEIEAAIDQAVHSELRLDREIGKIWRDMQKPLRLARQPDDIWLIPRPFSIAAAPVYGDARQITVPLQIAFRVDTRLGTLPERDTLERLPRLLRRAKVPEASRLRVLAFIPFTDLNRALDRRLITQKLELAGGTIKINSALVYGNGRSLIVKTDIGGAVNGTLYFRGQPHYDTLRNTLQVRHVDFDVDTKERLFATADWLLHDRLRDTLETVLAVPLHQHIASIPDKIETAYARAGAGKKTALDVDQFRLVPQRIVVRPDGVQILISVQSKVQVLVKRL